MKSINFLGLLLGLMILGNNPVYAECWDCSESISQKSNTPLLLAAYKEEEEYYGDDEEDEDANEQQYWQEITDGSVEGPAVLLNPSPEEEEVITPDQEEEITIDPDKENAEVSIPQDQEETNKNDSPNKNTEKPPIPQPVAETVIPDKITEKPSDTSNSQEDKDSAKTPDEKEQKPSDSKTETVKPEPTPLVQNQESNKEDKETAGKGTTPGDDNTEVNNQQIVIDNSFITNPLNLGTGQSIEDIMLTPFQTNYTFYERYPLNLADYADHWVMANPNRLTFFDLRGLMKQDYKLNLYVSRNSTLVNNGDGTLSYTSNPRFQGVDTFIYSLTDNTGKSISYTVKVNVTNNYLGYDYWNFSNSMKGYDYSGQQGQTLYNEWEPSKICNVIYAINDQGVGNSQMLYIDPIEKTAKAFGDLHRGYDLEGLEIDPVSYQLYTVSGGSADKTKRGYLHTINPYTGKVTTVGNTGFKDVAALAFRNDGSLWGWASGKGIIMINPETGHSYVRVPFKAVDAEGLAWTSNGKYLYAAEGNYLWWWRYGNDSTVERKCENLPGEVEALETLGDGMIMFAVHNGPENKLYAYDPWQCRIIDEQSFVTHYPDVEGIAWSIKCQPEPAPLPKATGWTGAFKKDKKTNMECREKPGWITVNGNISVQPTNTQAVVKTNWQVIKVNAQGEIVETTALCPDSDKSCFEPHYKKEIFTDSTLFQIQAWWPGVTLPLEKGSLQGLRFTAEVLDLDGNNLPGQPYLSKNLLWSESVCGNDKKNKNQKPAKNSTTEISLPPGLEEMTDTTLPLDSAKEDNSDQATDDSDQATKEMIADEETVIESGDDSESLDNSVDSESSSKENSDNTEPNQESEEELTAADQTEEINANASEETVKQDETVEQDQEKKTDKSQKTQEDENSSSKNQD